MNTEVNSAVDGPYRRLPQLQQAAARNIMGGDALLSHLRLTFVQFNIRFQCFNAAELPIDLKLTSANIKSTKFKETSKIPVMPAEERHPRMLLSGTGIQRLKSLDPGQKHAGMTITRDSSGGDVCQHARYSALCQHHCRRHTISTSLPINCPDTIDTTILFVSRMTTLAA